MHLSKHFTLHEAKKSQTAARHKINNQLPENVLPALKISAKNILDPIREEFKIPFSPNSWYRCPKLNALLNSKPTSQHLKGEAIDLELPTKTNKELYDWIANNLNFDQLILEYHNPHEPHSGWVHVSYVNHKKTATKNLK